MRSMIRGLRGTVLAAIAAGVLAGCAAPASRESMLPQGVTPAKKHPYSVAVDARGGSDTGAMDSSNISDADLKAAIEKAVTQSGVFRSVVAGKDGDYLLSVAIVQLSKPSFGLSFTVNLEAAWTLTKVSTGAAVLRKSIKSTHTATFGDSAVGVTRLQMAVEGAARENIRQGIQAIGALDL